MKIFIICSVRDTDQEYKLKLLEYAFCLTADGHEVHCPPFDTNQDASGYDICSENRAAICWADEVHIFYSGKSQGTHFDMGIAFAYGKKIVIAKNEPYGEGKSYPRMLDEWAERV